MTTLTTNYDNGIWGKISNQIKAGGQIATTGLITSDTATISDSTTVDCTTGGDLKIVSHGTFGDNLFSLSSQAAGEFPTNKSQQPGYSNQSLEDFSLKGLANIGNIFPDISTINADVYLGVLYLEVTGIPPESVFKVISDYKNALEALKESLDIEINFLILPVRDQETDLQIIPLMKKCVACHKA